MVCTTDSASTVVLFLPHKPSAHIRDRHCSTPRNTDLHINILYYYYYYIRIHCWDSCTWSVWNNFLSNPMEKIRRVIYCIVWKFRLYRSALYYTFSDYLKTFRSSFRQCAKRVFRVTAFNVHRIILIILYNHAQRFWF